MRQVSLDRRNEPRQKHLQHGAALMVAMIMIFMMSILGISALRGSSLEYQMAVNAIQSQEVLQGAESATDKVLNDGKALKDAYESDDDSVDIDTALRDDIGMSSSVTLKYVGDGNAIGASLDASGRNSFEALKYVAEGSATIAAVNATRKVHQGASRNVPSLQQ